jgi:hypothetical protein
MEVLDVKIFVDKEDTEQELASNFCQTCAFCEKFVKVSRLNFKSCCHLSGKKFYCPFCLRHNFHYRSARNVLILSYRAIIACFYYSHYLSNRTLWLSEIHTLIDRHRKIGLQNPTFAYDPFTMLWFIDFNKVGGDAWKAPYKEIETTLHSILLSFDLDQHIRKDVHKNMWKKYQDAALLFYQKRQRPKNNRMLIPTLKDIVFGEKPEFFDKTRNFVVSCLEIS